MNCCYSDILSLIKQKPVWFDEHAVPRFCEFSPKQIANIYADECLLLAIVCQACGRPFKACLSWSKRDEWLLHKIPAFSKSIETQQHLIHYGDPPNIECCPAGPTMSSDPQRVLEFWARNWKDGWKRRNELEIELR